ncbi:sodium-dependent phosphate transport protein 2B [Biomphalaria glabrata]|nr:sodium-dependent phosphate transport protein 2B [Biomphalaria glabrata]
MFLFSSALDRKNVKYVWNVDILVLKIDLKEKHEPACCFISNQVNTRRLIEMKVQNSWKGSTNGKTDDESSDSECSSQEEDVLFKDMSTKQKIKFVFTIVLKLLSFLSCLYVFIVSLGLLESAFQLLGGKAAGKAFNSGVLSNPLAGLMLGVLATVMVQSSSTSTSIVVTMVGSNIIPVEKAVYIIMGANIGTSVTNTIVSLAQISNRNEFRRAFSGATVHDMFNWLAVIVLLPIEVAVGYLSWLSGLLVDSMGLKAGSRSQAPDMLKAITKPVIDAIVQVNEDAISDAARNVNNTGDVLKRWCKSQVLEVNTSTTHHDFIEVNCSDSSLSNNLRRICTEVNIGSTAGYRSINLTAEWDTRDVVNETVNIERCDSLFSLSDLHDAPIGAIILICSLILLLLALFLIVKILNSMLSGSVIKVIKKTINADFPGPFAYFTGYVALIVGCGMTMIIQSSSVFTSTLTPMVGLGIVSVDRMYPMTLGSNIGTTITAILAALSQSGDKLRLAMQIALCHLFFNISGIMLFYPIPFLRWPVSLAKNLGRITSKYRWFAIFYIILMFIMLPAVVFGLSIAGWIYLGAIGGPILFFFIIVIIINILQKKQPRFLPSKLRTWEFLPLWCHSLKPVDNLIAKAFTCKYCRKLQQTSKEDKEEPLEMTITVETPEVQKKDILEEDKTLKDQTEHSKEDKVCKLKTIESNDVENFLDSSSTEFQNDVFDKCSKF